MDAATRGLLERDAARPPAVFVSEYLTCGAWPGELSRSSLAAEGRAMVEAVIADLARMPGARVVTTWDARLDPPRGAGVSFECRLVRNPDEERRVFGECAAACEATLVIAPEFDGILLDRRRLVSEAGGRWLGCSADAIELCADKLRLAEHLRSHGVRTIETWPLAAAPTAGEHLVVKPRDGAGSQLTFLVRNQAELDGVLHELAASDWRERVIVQPFMPGQAVSVTAVVSEGGRRVEVLPLADQHLSDDGRFRYLGGRVRFPPPQPEQSGAESLVRAACRAVSGLSGYVGFDLILPAEDPAAPVLVEINPRLTTSYLGYRRLTSDNLAERLLHPDRSCPPPVWDTAAVHFRPDGRLERAPAAVRLHSGPGG
ncbi:MAG TPA: ATP-grasp domain-containing protein [Planctomycetaceae bacterium]|nr:ATP-grasp domain-containing protein [Planctomycetaceae bacterium]